MTNRHQLRRNTSQSYWNRRTQTPDPDEYLEDSSGDSLESEEGEEVVKGSESRSRTNMLVKFTRKLQTERTCDEWNNVGHNDNISNDNFMNGNLTNDNILNDSYVMADDIETYTQNSAQDPLRGLSSCLHSGQSSRINCTYKNEGSSHSYEDSSFRITLGGDSFYGVLDGHDGAEVTKFARDTLIHEITKTSPDPRVVLEQAVKNVDLQLHERIRPLVEERASIKIKISGAKNTYEAWQAYPDEITRLGDIEDQIKGGTTAVVAMVKDNVLYVANVGDSRAVLVSLGNTPPNDNNVEFQIDQLSEDHTTANDNELDRLAGLGLDKQQIQGTRRVGSMETTRSIGDFGVKWGYKDFDILSNATNPPVICDPYVSQGLPINSSFYFLFLMSDGVYHAVEEMSDCVGSDSKSPDPNLRIAHLLHEQLKSHRNCQKAAENVLEEICKSHRDSWESGCGNCCRRDDMTLLVRLFNNPNKLYGHRRNHSGTIFRSSFSFTSTSSGDTVTPQPASSSCISDMLSDMLDLNSSANTPKPVPVLRTNDGTSSPYTNSHTSPLSPSNASISPSQTVFNPESSEPYVQFGDDFPDEMVLGWIKEDLKLPDSFMASIRAG